MARMRWAGGALAAVGALGLWGCNRHDATPRAPEQPFRGVKVTVAAVGDPAVLRTVGPQRGDWQQRRGGEVAILDAPLEPKAAAPRADVLIFPGERLGDLVDAGALAVLEESVVRPAPRGERDPEGAGPQDHPSPPADDYAFDDVLPVFREQATRYGTDRMALPYGGSGLVLVYRRDALTREANRAAAREAGLDLGPPRTWEEFDRLAKFLHGRDWDGDGRADAGLAVALGPDAEGLGEATLLARAVGPGLHRDQFSFLFDADTMEPRIAAPPFVEALEALVRWRDLGPPGAAGFDAEAARGAFRSGAVALLIDRAERASRWADPRAPIPVGLAALPGSRRVFDPERRAWEDVPALNRPSYLPGGGGWLIGVSSSTPPGRLAAAIDLVKDLTSPEPSGRIRADRAFPMLPTRASQLTPPDPRSAPGVEPRLWSKAVADTLLARGVPGLRIPDAAGYLSDLGKGRAAAVGGTPAPDALNEVARAWAARTRALGVARQLWHYRRSLNGPDTAPEPPAR